jgi:RluA family pseudouridine synthase
MTTPTETRWIKEVVEFIVRPEEAGKRLDILLQSRMKVYSREKIQSLIDRHNREPDVAPLKAGRKMKRGERFQLMLIRPVAHEHKVEIRIHYEDDWILVVEKDAETPVHGGGKRISTLVSALRDAGFKKLWTIHRLDRETSGLILFAKDMETARILQANWSPERTERKERRYRKGGRIVQKKYLALVHGVPARTTDVIDLPIGYTGGKWVRMKQGVLPIEAGGKRAVTAYRLLRRWKDFSLLSVAPRSGRMHQIRVHLSHIGHPIVGDKIYGLDESIYCRSIADEMTSQDRDKLMSECHLLHAHALAIQHPVHKTPLTVRCRMPESWIPLLKRLAGSGIPPHVTSSPDSNDR